jgi:hypothetical protein
MLMMKERRPAFRTIDGWARSALLEAGAMPAMLLARADEVIE